MRVLCCEAFPIPHTAGIGFMCSLTRRRQVASAHQQALQAVCCTRIPAAHIRSVRARAAWLEAFASQVDAGMPFHQARRPEAPAWCTGARKRAGGAKHMAQIPASRDEPPCRRLPAGCRTGLCCKCIRNRSMPCPALARGCAGGWASQPSSGYCGASRRGTCSCWRTLRRWRRRQRCATLRASWRPSWTPPAAPPLSASCTEALPAAACNLHPKRLPD